MKYIETTMLVHSWESFLNTIKEFDTDDWLFRGQKDSTWVLKTSLERACDNYTIPKNKIKSIENGMIRKYFRHLPSYGITDINKSDIFRIISLMQHYGCPTRFLDFTHSSFSALFFAIEDIKMGDYAAIWAINSTWLDHKYKKYAPLKYHKLLKYDEYEKGYPIMEFFFKYPSKGLKHIGPYILNDRITAQNGTFIMPLDISESFMDNLYFKSTLDELSKNIVKIIIDCNSGFIQDAYKKLNNMGISRATMFPGIEGFSSHLKTCMLLPSVISPSKNGKIIP